MLSTFGFYVCALVWPKCFKIILHLNIINYPKAVVNDWLIQCSAFSLTLFSFQRLCFCLLDSLHHPVVWSGITSLHGIAVRSESSAVQQ